MSEKGALGALLLAAACVAAPQPADRVALVNPGFEAEGEPGRPSGWHVDAKLLDKGSVGLDRKLKASGNASLVLAPNERNTPGADPLAAGQMLSAAPWRGRRIQVSAWLEADGGATAVLGLAVIPKGGGQPLAFQRLSRDSDAGASVSEASLDVPDTSQAEYLIVFCAVEGTSGAARFDDVELRSGETKAAAADAPGPPLDAEVRVDARDDLRAIPRSLYGTNVEWVWNGNGIWDAARDAPDDEVVRLSAGLGVSLIRFPGGVFSDYYHFRDGLGPQAARKESLHYPNGPKSRHTFGTEEAFRFADKVGARLLITVNAGSGSADEAADWVRYANRAGRRVELWEVGNELYMKGDYSGGSLPPSDYARHFLEFAKAMRAADPTIRIGAIGGQNYGRYRFMSYSDWDPVVLEAAGGAIDFLAVHNAYAPVLVGESQPDPRAVYAALLAAPVQIQANLATLARQIRSHVPRRAGEIQIAVTEWGPLFDIRPDSPFVDHVKTLGSALFVASTMNAFLRSPSTTVANFFKLTEPTFMGWIGPRDGHMVAKAPYLALQLFTRHFGDELVTSAVEGPAYDSPAVGALEAVKDVPYLDITASRSVDRRRLFIMAVNRHPSRAIRARIRLDGFMPKPAGEAWTLRGSGLDANTGTAIRNETPGLVWARQQEVPPWRRFYKGGPEEVRLAPAPLDGLGPEFRYEFTPLSATSIEIRAQ